eukprot:gene21609-27648_t
MHQWLADQKTSYSQAEQQKNYAKNRVLYKLYVNRPHTALHLKIYETASKALHKEKVAKDSYSLKGNASSNLNSMNPSPNNSVNKPLPSVQTTFALADRALSPQGEVPLQNIVLSKRYSAISPSNNRGTINSANNNNNNNSNNNLFASLTDRISIDNSSSSNTNSESITYHTDPLDCIVLPVPLLTSLDEELCGFSQLEKIEEFDTVTDRSITLLSLFKICRKWYGFFNSCLGLIASELTCGDVEGQTHTASPLLPTPSTLSTAHLLHRLNEVTRVATLTDMWFVETPVNTSATDSPHNISPSHHIMSKDQFISQRHNPHHQHYHRHNAQSAMTLPLIEYSHCLFGLYARNVQSALLQQLVEGMVSGLWSGEKTSTEIDNTEQDLSYLPPSLHPLFLEAHLTLSDIRVLQKFKAHQALLSDSKARFLVSVRLDEVNASSFSGGGVRNVKLISNGQTAAVQIRQLTLAIESMLNEHVVESTTSNSKSNLSGGGFGSDKVGIDLVSVLLPHSLTQLGRNRHEAATVRLDEAFLHAMLSRRRADNLDLSTNSIIEGVQDSDIQTAFQRAQEAFTDCRECVLEFKQYAVQLSVETHAGGQGQAMEDLVRLLEW